jgi:hypothetical protein
MFGIRRRLAVFDGLMGGAILAARSSQREHMDDTDFHQCAQRIARVIGEGQERPPNGTRPPCRAMPFIAAAMPNSRTPRK